MPKTVQIGRPVRRRFRRRRFKRRTMLKRVPRAVSARVHTFKRKCRYSPLVIAGAGNGYCSAGYVFALDDLPGYTDFTNLYEQFMITYVKMHIVSRSTNLSLIESYNNASIGLPEILFAIDKDDNTAPTADSAGMEDLRQRGDSRGFLYHSARRDCEIKLKPCVLRNMYEGVASTAYSPKSNVWVSTADPATPHYGVKLILHVPFSTGAMPANLYFDVYCTYWLKCRNSK